MMNSRYFFVKLSSIFAAAFIISLADGKYRAIREHVEKVNITFYYESMCPFSRMAYSKQLKEIIRRLGPYVNVYTNPYGSASTIYDGENIIFKCQHGKRECYGNKLHSCAIDLLREEFQSIFFNACLMSAARDKRGSDDKAADYCGEELNVDPVPIKKCAKQILGAQLLAKYGAKVKKIDLAFVPYILVNGVVSESDGDNLFAEVCSAFRKKPKNCLPKHASEYLRLNKSQAPRGIGMHF